MTATINPDAQAARPVPTPPKTSVFTGARLVPSLEQVALRARILARAEEASRPVHDLKSAPHFFQPVWDGDKTFEVRFDDRGYQRGDSLLLREWDARRACTCRDNARTHDDACPRYTGRWIAATVGFCVTQTTNPSGQGFNGRGYIVMSILPFAASDPDAPCLPDWDEADVDGTTF